MEINSILVLLAGAGGLFFFGRGLFAKFLQSSAEKAMESAKQKDAGLQKEISDLGNQAAKSEGKTEQLEKQIDSRKEGEVSEDWNKDWRKK